MIVPNTTPVFAVPAALTSPGNNALVANALANRFFRGIYATNTTGAAITLTVGIGAVATLSSANSDVAFGLSIPANAASFPVAQYGGRGRRALGVGSLNALMAGASATGLLLTAVYEDDLLT